MDTKAALEKLEAANKKLKRSKKARNAQQQQLIDTLLLLTRVLIEKNL